jgi:two-component system chemotaxis sensor kinase CheA
VRGISGSSILGSGDVALILDVPQLMQEAQAARSQAAH